MVDMVVISDAVSGITDGEESEAVRVSVPELWSYGSGSRGIVEATMVSASSKTDEGTRVSRGDLRELSLMSPDLLNVSWTSLPLRRSVRVLAEDCECKLQENHILGSIDSG